MIYKNPNTIKYQHLHFLLGQESGHDIVKGAFKQPDCQLTRPGLTSRILDRGISQRVLKSVLGRCPRPTMVTYRNPHSASAFGAAHQEALASEASGEKQKKHASPNGITGI